MMLKKLIGKIVVFLILAIPLSVGIYLELENNTLILLLTMSSIFVLYLHIPLISNFKALGVSVEMKEELDRAAVTINRLTETLVPLVETMYTSMANTGLFVETITDDSDLPLAKLAKHLNIYSNPHIVEERVRMYNLGKYSAFRKIGRSYQKPSSSDDFDEEDEYKIMIDHFKSKYDASNDVYPSILELQNLNLQVKSNKFGEHKAINDCIKVIYKQDLLIREAYEPVSS